MEPKTLILMALAMVSFVITNTPEAMSRAPQWIENYKDLPTWAFIMAECIRKSKMEGPVIRDIIGNQNNHYHNSNDYHNNSNVKGAV